MNLFQLVLKQMRQRSLSTWLTMLSILLGVGLGSAIMILQRGAGVLFGQTEYAFDVLIGAKGSPLQLTLNTVYQLDKSPGNIPYSLYEQMMTDRKYRSDIKIAVPLAVGDSYKGQRIVATMPKMFGVDDEGKELDDDHNLGYRPEKHFQIAQGKVFAPNKFEAVIGSDIPQLTGLKLGDQFQATHGMPAPNMPADVHPEQWTVAGVLAPTHTAADRVVYIPLITFYCIFEHEAGLEAIAQLQQGKAPAPATKEAEEEKHYSLNPDGTIDLKLPKSDWMLSAIMVHSRGGFNARNLMWNINNQNVAAAVSPAEEMRKFFDVFLSPSSRLLQAVSYLVTVVAGVGILVSIYNSVSARMREIAILRALGATRHRILTLICVEAGLIGLLGGTLGLLAGHVLGAAGSVFVERLVGEGFNWINVGPEEWIYLGAVVVLSVLAGLVPAMKAYRTPVADNLVAA
ncbi:MAG TPA: ABC transporter permease [Tepidisphaeraceae bacterium]|nr:ABC transporter permease [Tepidisphaeraceae bacterium]